MDEKLIQILGLIAGSLTTLSFLPQVIKTYRSRSAKDLSLAMFLVFCIGVMLWIIYGLLKNDTPLIIANLITFLLALSLLFAKFKFKP